MLYIPRPIYWAFLASTGSLGSHSVCVSVRPSVCDILEFFTLSKRKILRLVHYVFNLHIIIRCTYLPGLEFDAGKGTHLKTDKRIKTNETFMNSITKTQSDSSRVTVQGKLMLTSFQVMYEDHSSSILRHREIFICLQSQHCFRTPCKVSECCNSPFLTSCSSFEYSLKILQK